MRVSDPKDRLARVRVRREQPDSKECGKRGNYLKEPLAKSILREHASLGRFLGNTLDSGAHQGILLRWNQRKWKIESRRTYGGPSDVCLIN